MTQIDFYVLDGGVASTREQFACRLANKAYSKGMQVYLHVADEPAADALDEMLWTFRDGSFLPHSRADNSTAQDSPVIVGYQQPPAGFDGEMLINLAHDVPAFFEHYSRVAEMVGPDDIYRKQAREHFRSYRDKGFEPNTHDMTRK